MNKNELYNALICALTHDLMACEQCKRCKGNNRAEIRMNLIKEISKIFNRELPWKEDEND